MFNEATAVTTEILIPSPFQGEGVQHPIFDAAMDAGRAPPSQPSPCEGEGVESSAALKLKHPFNNQLRHSLFFWVCTAIPSF